MSEPERPLEPGPQPPSRRGGRARVVAIALLVLATVMAAGIVFGGARVATSPSERERDPSRVLDDALAAGRPAYLLFHSET